jgi:SCY1-like protein 1
VKAALVIITKLSDRTINGELLRYLAKTANDEQPGIRTNTTICLGRIAPHLGQGVSLPNSSMRMANEQRPEPRS